MCHKAIHIPDVGIDPDLVSVLHSGEDREHFIAQVRAEHAKLWEDEREYYGQPWAEGAAQLTAYEAGQLTAVLPWEYGVVVLY